MAMEPVQEYPVIWLQTQCCTGCSVSVLNAISPSIKNVLVDEVIPGKHVNLRFHATVMAGSGDLVIEELEETWQKKKGGYILVVEGAIPTAKGGIHGSIGERGDVPVSMMDRVEELARDALAVVAIGTCAAFGGIPSGKPNPTGAVGLREFFDTKGIATPLINLPGCPPHPDWFVGTVASVMLFGLPSADGLDDNLRPKAYYGKLIHENCERRAYFDEGKFAKKFSDEGCMYELGCKGPVTYADCPIRKWHGGLNWCVGCGATCIGCTEAAFPDMVAPFYEKLTDVDVPNIGECWKELEEVV